MLREYVSDLAAQMGMTLTHVHLVEGKMVGCFDFHTLMMSSSGCNVSTIIYQADLELLKSGSCCERLELRIQQALLRLQFMLEL